MAVLTFSTRVMGKLLNLDFFSLPLDNLSNSLHWFRGNLKADVKRLRKV